MGDSPSAADALEKANDRIRDAAKWLIASSAAVAAALIAGSQLSSIGKLAVALPTSVETARLWVAVFGAVVGLVAVVYILWTAVQLLPEVPVTIRDLVTEWDQPSQRVAPAVTFLKARPKYLQGFGSPADLEQHRERAVKELDEASDPAKIAELQTYIGDLDTRITAVENRASNKVLEGSFNSALRKLLWATAVAAVGIIGFAWAANPPADPPPTAKLVNAQLVGVNLRDSNLVNAKLDNADLSDADLTGADLTGASIAGVKWNNTICPDGVNSDAAGNTCAGHLSK